jgi:hypothetical protein
MTPENLRTLRAACADSPTRAAVLELAVLYEATPAQIGALRVRDVRETSLVFAPSRPGSSSKTAVRLIPSVAAHLRRLVEGREPDEPLVEASVLEIEDFLADQCASVETATLRPSGAECVRSIDESPLGRLRVVQDELGTWALSDVLPQGVVYASGEPPAHVFLWTHLDAWLPREPRLLLLGGGAFVGAALLEERYAPARLDVVELDPRCLPLARSFFGWTPGPTTSVHTADARTFVDEVDATWDAVLQDLADADGTLDWLAEPAWAAALFDRAPIVAANLITALGGPLIGQVEAALRAAGADAVDIVPLRTRADAALRQNVFVRARRAAR